MEPLREVPLARVEGKSSCAATPTVTLLRRGMDALPTATYHGSRRGAHGNERNAGGLCIAAGSSGLARAQAMLTGEMYRTHALSGTTERRAWRERATLAAACARYAL